MAVVLNAKGTTEDVFALGKQGPKLKNNSNIIEVRNTGDTDYIGFRSMGLTDNATATAITLDSSNNTNFTGLLYAPVGGAGTPTYSFASDPDTGMFRGGGNRLNFATAGSTQLSIDSTGALEIGNAGTSGISAKFTKNASNVNYLEFGGGVTTVPVTINARGTDTDVDITLNTKGAGDLKITTNSTDAIIIDSSQRVGIGSFAGLSARLNVLETSSSYTGDIFAIKTNTISGSGFNHIRAISDVDGTADPVFRVQGDGLVFADGAYSGSGADYADYFEWDDGNPDNEDRVGCSAVLTGNGKIKIASPGENPIGVISGRPSVAGNAASDSWSDKFLKDEYHRYIIEDGKKIVNPDYDPAAEYIPRPDRQEWDAVGLVGRLPVKKGQVISSSWSKIKDISNDVEEWLITGSGGSAIEMGPMSFSIDEDQLTEDTATEAKKTELAEYYYMKLSDGFVWNDETFDIDERAQYNISAEFMFQSQSIENFSEDFAWRGYENQIVKMNYDAFADFARAARNHVKLMREAKIAHEKSIDRKRLVKSIMECDITANWPETAEDFLNQK